MLAKGAPVPSAKQDKATAIAQFKDGVVKQARKLAKVKPPADDCARRSRRRGLSHGCASFPRTLKVKAGTTVDFKISSQARDPHDHVRARSVHRQDREHLHGTAAQDGHDRPTDDRAEPAGRLPERPATAPRVYRRQPRQRLRGRRHPVARRSRCHRAPRSRSRNPACTLRVRDPPENWTGRSPSRRDRACGRGLRPPARRVPNQSWPLTGGWESGALLHGRRSERPLLINRELLERPRLTSSRVHCAEAGRRSLRRSAGRDN